MKNTLRYASALLICGILAGCGVTKRMESRGPLRTSPDPQQLVVNAAAGSDTLHIEYLLEVPRNYVPRKAQVIYRTDLVRDTVRMNVSKIYLNGPTYERLMWRQARFEGRLPDYSDGVMAVSGREPFAISVSGDLVYEPWMQGAVLEATTDVGLCRERYVLAQRLLSGGVRYIAPAPPVVVVEQPAPQPVVLKEEGFVSLSYAVNSYRINPAFGNNRAQLEKMTDLVDKILSDSLLSTDKIVVTGICSPDGPYSYNSDLARNRAGTLRDYLVARLKVDPRLIQTDYVPEDWEGLRQLVEASRIDNKQTILSIIDGTQSPDAKEAALKRLPQYQTLKTTMFPRLRVVKYEIYYSERVAQ